MPEIRISERDFMAQVREYAELNGWLVYHTHDSRRSDAGFPDLVIVRDYDLYFVELKTNKGRVKPAQEMWLSALRRAFYCSERVWRPQDWDEIERTLRR